MAKIETYTVVSPALGDKIVVTDVDDSNNTKNVTIESVLALQGNEVVKIIPSGTSGIYTIAKADWPTGQDYAVPKAMIDSSTRENVPIPWTYDVLPNPTEIRINIGVGTLPNSWYIIL